VKLEKRTGKEIFKIKYMKIAVITYDVPHKKTQDILMRLIGKDVTVIAMPFKERKPIKKLYWHRPNMNTNISTIELCKYFGFSHIKHNNPIELTKEMDVTLIGGCGIIKTDNSKIINSHPAYLPFCRGLDALKWAIYKGEPIGVTTHVIDSEIDSGYLIEQEFISVNFYDTFHSVAIRQYEKEIDMIIRAINKPIGKKIYNEHHKPNTRMPIELEPIMMERFNKLRIKF
jgi:phosphoribosylglycinamide formyltransferase-1